jgi:hypothetical protein
MDTTARQNESASAIDIKYFMTKLLSEPPAVAGGHFNCGMQIRIADFKDNPAIPLHS